MPLPRLAAVAALVFTAAVAAPASAQPLTVADIHAHFARVCMLQQEAIGGALRQIVAHRGMPADKVLRQQAEYYATRAVYDGPLAPEVVTDDDVARLIGTLEACFSAAYAGGESLDEAVSGVRRPVDQDVLQQLAGG